MKTTRAFLLALAALAAGCGGGGGNSGNNPPPPPPSQVLAISLEATGSIPGMGASAVPSGLLLINSLAEYDALYAGAGATGPIKPAELRALDFTQSSIFYVEGPADDFLGAVARLREIRRTNGTQDSVSAERCTNDAAGIPTPSRAHRPYAFYVVPKLMAGVTYAWSTALAPGCNTVDVVSPLTFVAPGMWGLGPLPGAPFGSRAITTQADLDAVLPSFPLGLIPPQYRAPDFTQVTLVFVVGRAAFLEDSYVRVDRVLANDDGSRDVIVEYCGNYFTRTEAPEWHGPFALYAVPRVTGEVRFSYIPHQPGACVLPR